MSRFAPTEPAVRAGGVARARSRPCRHLLRPGVPRHARPTRAPRVLDGVLHRNAPRPWARSRPVWSKPRSSTSIRQWCAAPSPTRGPTRVQRPSCRRVGCGRDGHPPHRPGRRRPRPRSAPPPRRGRPRGNGAPAAVRGQPRHDAGNRRARPAWQAATALREHRGDGHVAVLTEAGLDGCEAHVLYVAATSVDPEVLHANRGWSHTEWSDAIDRLHDRGLVTAACETPIADTHCPRRSSGAPTSSRCGRSRRSRLATSIASSPSRGASPGPLPLPARFRTRIRWDRSGVLEAEDFPVAEVSEYLEQPDTIVWVDFCAPSKEQLDELAGELGLHELAVEDALGPHQRPEARSLRDPPVPVVPRGAGRRRSRRPRRVRDRRVHQRAVGSSPCARTRLLDGRRARALGPLPRSRRPRRELPALRAARRRGRRLLRRRPGASTSTTTRSARGSSPSSRSTRRSNGTGSRCGARWSASTASSCRCAKWSARSCDASTRMISEDLYPYYQDIYDHILRVSESTDSLRDLVEHHRRDQPQPARLPPEPDREEGQQLGRDHRRARAHHRLLRHERPVPRLRATLGLRRVDRAHGRSSRARSTASSAAKDWL